jgi:hypothetical protein
LDGRPGTDHGSNDKDRPAGVVHSSGWLDPVAGPLGRLMPSNEPDSSAPITRLEIVHTTF